MTGASPELDYEYLMKMRDELISELKESPEVETVGLGKIGDADALVVLVKRSAPERLRIKWREPNRTFKGIPVAMREWGIPRAGGALSPR
jgi:hypothetical protein